MSITSLNLDLLLNDVKNNEIDQKIVSPNSSGITNKIDASDHNEALTSVLEALRQLNDSTYNKLDIITGVTVNDTLVNLLDDFQAQLDSKHPLISPINTAFNKNFGIGGSSVDIPRFDDPRFTDERIPINNSVSTVKLQDNSVNNNKLSDMVGFSIKGNSQSTLQSPQDLTAVQVRTLLNIENGSQVNYTAKNSLELDSNEYQLVGDIASVNIGDTFYYGSDSSQQRGFYSLYDAISDYISLNGADDWGNQVVEIDGDVTSPLTNVYGVLEGTGISGDELLLNSSALQAFIEDVITFINPGDDWGSQVVNIGVGNGLVGDGDSTPLSLSIETNYSLLGLGTTADVLRVDETWLTGFINTTVSSSGGDDWGSQVAETSGVIEGNGLLATPIKIEDGDPSNRQILLWDNVSGEWTRYNSASLINLTQVYLDSDAPLTGTGTVSNPIDFIAGTADDDVLAWNATTSRWEVTAASSLPISSTVTTDNISITGTGTPANPVKIVDGSLSKDILLWNSVASEWSIGQSLNDIAVTGESLLTQGSSGFAINQKGIDVGVGLSVSSSATDITIDLDASANSNTATISYAGGASTNPIIHNLNTETPIVRLYLVDYPVAGRDTLLNLSGTSIATYLEDLQIEIVDLNTIEISVSNTVACDLKVITKRF